jgi:tetratricopeptide (TPR) repeat protein
MGTHWARKEVKKNLTAEKVNKIMLWIKNHRETFTASSIIFLAAVILAVFFVSRYSKIKETAWKTLFMAQQYAYAGRSAETMSQLSELETGYANTDAAGFGLLFKGDLLYKQGSYKEAAETYQKLIEKPKPKGAIPFAISGIGKSRQAMGNFPEAITAYTDFLEKYPDHYLAPEIYIAMASCYEAMKNPQEAKTVYEKIAVLFPDTYWFSYAQQKLQGPKPPEQPKSK